jgi:hypothetical protein
MKQTWKSNTLNLCSMADKALSTVSSIAIHSEEFNSNEFRASI